MQLRSSGTAAADIAAKPLCVRCMPPRREQHFSRGALLVTARSGTSKPAADDGRVPAEADVRYRRCIPAACCLWA